MKQRETELILRAARLYYEDHHSQDQVAAMMGTSRSNISRMLSDAKRLGFVEIRVVAPVTRHENLSSQLQNLLGIKEVQVITTDKNELALNAVGRAAAKSLINSLSNNQTIAISWGRGLEATIVNVRSEAFTGLKVTQLMGSLSSVTTSASAEEVGRQLAKNLNAQFIPFLAPVVVSNSRTRDTLLEEEIITKPINLARAADVAIIGIGSKGSSSSEMVINEFKFSKTERDLLYENYAGDVAARFYDLSGQSLSSKMDKRVLGLTLAEIRAIPRVIGVASGTEKAFGVIGAARSQMLDVLIVDLVCANTIMKTLAPSAVKSA
ncbi:MAG: sugar-binding domain-containing protein [Actinomycetes bacterium]